LELKFLSGARYTLGMLAGSSLLLAHHLLLSFAVRQEDLEQGMEDRSGALA
jgi:hypothetical protein